MSGVAYRRAKWGMWSCLGICALGLVAAAGLAATFHYLPAWYARLGGWAVVLCALPVPVSIILAGVRYARLNRQRIAQLAPVCSQLGFHPAISRTPEAAADFFAPLSAIAIPLTLDQGAKCLAWWATAESPLTPAWLFEHEYFRGSGKTTVSYAHTVLARRWPQTEISQRFAGASPRFAVSRHAALLRGAPFPHGRPVHSWTGTKITWAVEGDGDAAARFLTPAVQAQLELAPYGEWWYVGDGWVCCVLNAKCDAASLPGFVAHARAALHASAQA
jgi:hypothetical protein